MWWGSNYIAANSSRELSGGFPTCDLENEVWVIKGIDDHGNNVEFKYCVNLSQEDLGEKLANPDYDTANLRYNADFEKQVADNVYWVPAKKLGNSNYTNKQIAAMVGNSPEEKQKTIKTLYEALQLYQICGFKDANDNLRIKENGIDWEHHKPGYHAVRTNEGCCATDSNWLNYILKSDYNEVGFIAFSQTDGSGHIFNYIKDNGYYYIIDLTHYRLDFLTNSAVESGDLNAYNNSDCIGGNIHKAKSLEDFVNYYRKAATDPPELFFTYMADDCLPLDGVRKDGKLEITYPNTQNIKVLYDEPNDTLIYKYVEPPKSYPDWSKTPSANFEAHLP